MIYSYAEVLYPDVKKLLEKTFDCPVYQIYQGSEGSYAITCKHGNLHVNEDLVLFESYDKDGKPTPNGEPCYRLLVTDLHKKSQPIIRYELNNIITISKNKCKCGSSFRVIEQIQGRADDLFWGIKKDGNKHFIYQDYISRMIISTSEDIDDYQAIQDDYDNVTLRIKLIDDRNKINIEKMLIIGIRNIFLEYQCKEPKVNVVFGDPLPNERSNKLIRIICNIKNA